MPYCAMDTGEYVRQANRETFLMVQIEEAAALERAEAIAAVPGVDGIFFGPGDFSVLSGFPGDIENAKVVNATKRIAQAAKNAGKRWGMPAFSIDHARELLSMGASFLAQGCDIVAVKEAFELIQKQFAPLGFTFENRLEPGKSYLAGNVDRSTEKRLVACAENPRPVLREVRRCDRSASVNQPVDGFSTRDRTAWPDFKTRDLHEHPTLLDDNLRSPSHEA